MSNLTGLQLLQRLLDGDIPLPSMLTHAPILGGHISRGEFELKFKATDQLLNLQGTVHGGFLATMLDTAATSAIQTLLGPNMGVVTLDLRCEYFKPVQANVELAVIATADNVGRTIGFSSARVVDTDYKTLVRGSATCSILQGT